MRKDFFNPNPKLLEFEHFPILGFLLVGVLCLSLQADTFRGTCRVKEDKHLGHNVQKARGISRPLTDRRARYAPIPFCNSGLSGFVP
jgi:hypothetical protein